jgi:heme oxygenase
MADATERSPSQARRLSQRLRGETKTLHAAAERSGVMRRLVRGELSRREYVSLLFNLAEIYGALESELERNRTHEALSWLDIDALSRRLPLLRDIEALGAADDVDVIVPTTAEYVERVRNAGANAPHLLISHAYVRYLGDLSGGQILGPIVGRVFGRDGRHVTSFYEFPLIADIAAFKRRFRDQLDRIGNGVASDGIIEETKSAFVLHERLFRELEQAPRRN